MQCASLSTEFNRGAIKKRGNLEKRLRLLHLELESLDELIDLVTDLSQGRRSYDLEFFVGLSVGRVHPAGVNFILGHQGEEECMEVSDALTIAEVGWVTVGLEVEVMLQVLEDFLHLYAFPVEHVLEEALEVHSRSSVGLDLVEVLLRVGHLLGILILEVVAFHLSLVSVID